MYTGLYILENLMYENVVEGKYKPNICEGKGGFCSDLSRKCINKNICFVSS